MARNLDAYSKRAFERKLSFLTSQLSMLAEPARNPRAFLLGGQSGAGKTRLHKICGQQLGDNVIVINGDEFRKSHPNFSAIQERYGVDAPAHTAQWAGKMTEALIDAFSAQGYNLIIEGTLRTSEVPLRTAALLRERGYAVSLAIMAVKPEISLVSCQIRYEMMRLAGTTPRATDPEHHNKIVRDIADNLAVLEGSGSFDRIAIYDRAERLLYPTDDSPKHASDALHGLLFGKLTPEEREHYEHLKSRLDELRHM